jgi:long-subunit acyl-CoA synthetase (AMP-forming)
MFPRISNCKFILLLATCFKQGYGMTETCGIISLEHPEKGESRQFGSTGTLVTGVEAKIVETETLKLLPPNKLGEICVRGPNIMQGTFLSGFNFSQRFLINVRLV